MTKAKTIITRVPFSGFYESIWSSEIDRAQESFCEYEADYRQAENGIPAPLRISESDLNDIIFRHSNFRIAYEKIAAAYVDGFNAVIKSESDLDLRLTFESMSSPREYNFETDRIFAHIPVSVVKRLWAISKAENHERLKVRIRECYTSRDGFWSHYANDLTDGEWAQPVTDYDHNQLCTLIEAVSGYDPDEWESLYYAVFDDSCVAHNAFSDAVDWPAFEQACAEMREEMESDIRDDDPDFVMPYRCPETPDLFQAMFNEATRAYFSGVRS